MKISKLKYTNKETAISDLLDKGVYTEDLSFGEGIHAIVELGKICINQPTEEIKPIFAEGYHYDVMSEQEIDFKENEIVVNNPKHGFLGYDTKN
jgi:hypothetical protein